MLVKEAPGVSITQYIRHHGGTLTILLIFTVFACSTPPCHWPIYTSPRTMHQICFLKENWQWYYPMILMEGNFETACIYNSTTILINAFGDNQKHHYQSLPIILLLKWFYSDIAFYTRYFVLWYSIDIVSTLSYWSKSTVSYANFYVMKAKTDIFTRITRPWMSVKGLNSWRTSDAYMRQ